MLTGTHTNAVIPSRRLILVAKVGSNGLEARVSVKCTLYAGSEPHATSNKIAVPIELHSAVRTRIDWSIATPTTARRPSVSASQTRPQSEE